MSEALVRIAAFMLDRYADKLGNAGCNDFPELEVLIPDRAEREKFVLDFNRWNEHIGPDDTPDEWEPGEDSLPDFAVARYVSHLLSALQSLPVKEEGS